MRCREVAQYLDRLAPCSYAESWDNVGLLAGDWDKEIHTVFVAVDATDRVIEEACLAGADMLITHHPLIFSGLKSVNEDHFIGRRVRRLIREDICYYAMHTNFDIAGDMAGLVTDKLPFGETRVLCEQRDGFGLGRIGRLTRPMQVSEFAAILKERLSIEDVVLYGDKERSVELVAVLPGSGSQEIDLAVSQGAELMVTGDINHHDGIDALAKGLMLMDAGHYGLEKVFVEYMKHSLEKEWGDSVHVAAEQPVRPFSII